MVFSLIAKRLEAMRWLASILIAVNVQLSLVVASLRRFMIAVFYVVQVLSFLTQIN